MYSDVASIVEVLQDFPVRLLRAVKSYTQDAFRFFRNCRFSCACDSGLGFQLLAGGVQPLHICVADERGEGEGRWTGAICCMLQSIVFPKL